MLLSEYFLFQPLIDALCFESYFAKTQFEPTFSYFAQMAPKFDLGLLCYTEEMTVDSVTTELTDFLFAKKKNTYFHLHTVI